MNCTPYAEGATVLPTIPPRVALPELWPPLLLVVVLFMYLIRSVSSMRNIIDSWKQSTLCILAQVLGVYVAAHFQNGPSRGTARTMAPAASSALVHVLDQTCRQLA